MILSKQFASMTSPFASLPADIVPLLFAPLSRLDFYSLCLVCREIRALAEPYLYSNIHFSWEIESRPPPLPAIVRTILERPELGGHVRSLIVDGDVFIHVFRGPRHPPKLQVAEGTLQAGQLLSRGSRCHTINSGLQR